MARKPLVSLVCLLVVTVIALVPGDALSQSCDLSDYDGWTIITENSQFAPLLSGPTGPTCFFIAPKESGTCAGTQAACTTNADCTSNKCNYPGYVIPPITIERSIYLHGSDPIKTRLIASDHAQPLFTVPQNLAVPIHVNFARMTLQPTGATFYPIGSKAFVFGDGSPGTVIPVTFEMFDVVVDRSELLIQRPGTYRLQNVGMWGLGMNESLLIVDHPDADVLVIGADMGGGSKPVAIEYCQGSAGQCIDPATTCDVDADCGAGSQCLLDAAPIENGTQKGVCTTSGACATQAGCATGDRCIAVDQNQCETYHALQRRGRLRIVSSSVVKSRGDADIRFESSAAQGHHLVADTRSEGPKCANTLPATLVSVPSSTEPIDLLLLNNLGGWYAPINCLDSGDARLADYNADGDLWLVSNNGGDGTGRLVTGSTGPDATITAIGNRFFGNTESADPRDLLPVEGGTEFTAGNLYSRERFYVWCVATKCGSCSTNQTACGTDDDCPMDETCDLPGDDTGCDPFSFEVCDAGVNEGKICDPGTCEGTCRQPHPCNSQLTVDFVEPLPETIDDNAFPRFGPTEIPPAFRHPTVSAYDPVATKMVDSNSCFVGWCDPYYPDDCRAKGPKRCSFTGDPCQNNHDCAGPVPQVCLASYGDRCALQATLNKALALRKPVLLREGDYEVGEPLYYVDSRQFAEDADLGAAIHPDATSGGWIVGENGNVTIRAADVCRDSGLPCGGGCGGADECQVTDGTVFATEMRQGVVQGIRFEGLPFTGTCGDASSCFTDADCSQGACETSTTATTVQIENDPDFAGQQKTVTFDGCEFVGGRHAFGNCMNSSIQCDTNRVVGSTFSNAGLGFGIGGWNALQVLAYDVLFDGNAVAMGHDPAQPGSVGRGKWSLLRGTSTDTRVKDIELDGGGALYVHGLDSNAEVLLREDVSGTGVGASVLVENSDLHPQVDGMAAEFSYTNGLTLLRSRFDPGNARLWNSFGAKHLLKLVSFMPRWDDVLLGDDTSPDADAQKSEWVAVEECPATPDCGGPNCVPLIPEDCNYYATQSVACSGGNGLAECWPGAIWVKECQCTTLVPGTICLSSYKELVCLGP